METSTTIRKMIANNRIIVPAYQRAYSWETPSTGSKRKSHTDVFLHDLDDYQKSNNAKTPYYFGHFLFEEKVDSLFHIIDGQQRLTTIIIYLSALFAQLKKLRGLTTLEKEAFEDTVKRNETYRFETVCYDQLLFSDYVIDQTKKDISGLETRSAERIAKAFNYFVEKLSDKDEAYLEEMLGIINKAACTTHQVMSESEAIQMFIFQNNRGKKPSDLEIIKAQFMYIIHLHGGDDSSLLIRNVQTRFETIYRTISSIEHSIDEDDVLIFTLRVYLNTLTVESISDAINKELAQDNPIIFIKEFSQALSASFEQLKNFFKHSESNYAIHSLVALGGIGIAVPFIIKAYQFGLNVEEVGRLSTALESLILRQRLIGTRAELETRMNDVFKKFTSDNSSIQEIVELVNTMKTTNDWWWMYWNNVELEKAIQGGLNHSVAKYLLWKYENHLISLAERGYGFYNYNQIEAKELEHISPKTEPNETPHGYDVYDEEFISNHLNCLGNYLLASKPHNASMQNDPFHLKHIRFTELKQQYEVQELGKDGVWNREIIQKRKKKIVQFVMTNF